MCASPSSPRRQRLLPWFWILAAGIALPLTRVAAQPAEDTAPTGSKATTITKTDDGIDIHIDVSDKDSNDVHFSFSHDGIVTRSADYVRFGESVHVKKGERVLGDVVSIGGSVDVDGEVVGDAVAIMGSVDLGPGAQVHGQVVSVGGSVSLDDSAFVNGDAVSVGGRLDLAETARINGESQEVGGFGLHMPHIGLRGSERERPFRFLARALWVLILIAVGIGAFRLFPTRMHNMADTVHQRGFVAFLAGFAGWILWLPVFIILCVTLIGIPVALLLIFLTPIMTLLGYLAVAEVSGGRLVSTLHQSDSPGRRMLLGVLTLEGLLLLAKFLGMMGSVFEFFGFILGLVGMSIIFVAATIGFGAFLMTRFKPPRAPREAAPAGTAPPVSTPPPAWSPPPSIPPPAGS